MEDKFNRRGSIKAVAGAFAATAVASSFPAPAIASGVREWVMVSTFPKGSPGLQQSGANVAKNIEELSGGRIKVKAFGAGELVPAMETFDAVRENKAQLGNSMPYFWTGKDSLTSFFSAAPGGLTAEEQAAWLYHGGGQELWDEVYAQYNLKGLMTGAFGSQQAGWFNKEINSLEDLQGLKIRIPGLAGEVLGRLGASPTMLPLGEVIGALQAGTIDAAEFIGGWVDLAFGFPKVAKYFYGPGFHEPGSTEELLVNLDEWNNLEDDLKAVVKHACRSEYAQHSALFTYHQPMALQKIVNEYDVQVKPFPDEVMEAIFKTSNELMLEIGDSSDLARKIYKSWDAYRQARIQFGDNQTLGLLKWRSAVAAKA